MQKRHVDIGVDFLSNSNMRFFRKKSFTKYFEIFIGTIAFIYSNYSLFSGIESIDIFIF